jgi:hypothetical protein
VLQANFYSLKSLDFKGRANSSYLIRFQTAGSHRLIFFHLTNLLLDSHVHQKLITEDVANHAVRVTDLKDEIFERMKRVKETILMDRVNQEGLNKGLDNYYFYNIAEIVVLGLICVIQVESVRKLLLSSSIV